MSAVYEANKTIGALLTAVEHLASNVHGTRLPYRPSGLSPEAREARDHQSRLERHERSDIAPGDSPDLYAFGVVDLLSEILSAADQLQNLASHKVGHDPLPHASSAYADPKPYLRTLRYHLEDASRHDPEFPRLVMFDLRKLLHRSDEMLGHLFGGQILDAECPVCGSRDERHPMGGGRTLRVRMSQDDEPRPLVVCEGGMCEPSTSQCGERWRGYPAWPIETEGAWLAKWIEKGQEQVCRCGTRIPPTGKRGRPAEFCGEECRRAADAERQRVRRAS